MREDFKLNLPGNFYQRLGKLAQKNNQDMVAYAEHLLMKAIEEEEETEEDSKDSDLNDLSFLKEYIRLLLGLRGRQGVSFTLVADVLGVGSRELEIIYRRLHGWGE